MGSEMCIRDSIGGDGIAKDENSAAAGQRLRVHITENEGLAFDDVVQSVLGVDTIVDRTLTVDTDFIATQSYVDDAIDDLIDGAPESLDTLRELAAALNDSEDFANDVLGFFDDVNDRIDSEASRVDQEILDRISGDSDLQMQIDNLPDSDTQYSAGNGLTLSDEEFSVDLDTSSGLEFDGGQLRVDEADGILRTSNGLTIHRATSSGLAFTEGGIHVLSLIHISEPTRPY